MRIKRDSYLRQLENGIGNGLVKIVSGIRRSGKTYLLFNIFLDFLHEQGIDDSHIIAFSLEDRTNISLLNPDNALSFVKSKIIDKKKHFVLIDEVQMMAEFTSVLNSLLHIPNVDVYVTGSNSKFLSKDISTEFRGRGDEIHIFPLTFSEFYGTLGGDKNSRWKEYYTYGGLPQVALMKENEKKARYLKNLQNTIFVNDIIERYKIRSRTEFLELSKIMSSGIGSLCNPQKLSRTYKSVKNFEISAKTIAKYLDYMVDAFAIEKSVRYSIKGKKYINTLSKYYFSDLGLRNSLLDFRQLEENHLMENAIYNELRARNYFVDVGVVETKTTEKNKTARTRREVDFVANKGDSRVYIQSAFSFDDDKKRSQELASLKMTGDSFKKIIVVRPDIMPYYDDNGFFIVGLMDFLLKG